MIIFINLSRWTKNAHVFGEKTGKKITKSSQKAKTIITIIKIAITKSLQKQQKQK
jgi:hypothetical protein